MDAKRRGGGLGRAGGSGIFFAVPNCLGFGTANLLTHMSLLPRDRGVGGVGHTRAHARAHARCTQAGTGLCNSLNEETKVSDGGGTRVPHNSRARGCWGLRSRKRNAAHGSDWRMGLKGWGRERGEGRGEWQGSEKKEMFGFFRMM